MWLNILLKLLIAVALLMLVIACATNDWQLLDLKKPVIHTNIGLWKTCSKTEGKKKIYHSTTADNPHLLSLYSIRIMSILTILVLVSALIVKNNHILLGAALLLSCLVPFIYSSQLENFFSQDFDHLMYSKYGYSYYLQIVGSMLLLIAMIIKCSL